MKIIFLSTIDVLAFLLILNTIKLISIKTPTTMSIARIGYACIASVVLYNLFMFSDTQFQANLFYSLFYVSIDVLLTCSVIYIDLYCDISKEITKKKCLVFIFLTIDIVSLLINPFTNHIFRCFTRVMSDKSVIWMTLINNIFYYYHFVASFIVGSVVLGTLLYKAIVVPSVYKKKYFVLIVFIVILTVCEFVNCTTTIYFTYTIVIFELLIIFASILPALLCVQLGNNISCQIFDDSKDGIICYDIEGNCINANNRMKNYIGCTDGVFDADDKFKDFIGNFVLEMLDKFNTYTITKDISSTSSVVFEINKNYVKDRYGEKIGIYYSICDKTDDKRQQGIDIFNSNHDKLTKLLNKQAFYSRVEETLVNNKDTEYCIVCTNVIDFKMYNEIFGTEIGDNLLRKIALGFTIHKNDDEICARLESDRFAVLMPKRNFKEKNIKDTLRSISESFSTSVYKVHLCAGVYEIDDITLPVQIMCDRAIFAISSVSDEYSVSIAYFSDGMLHNSLRESRFISEFELAVRNDQFMVYLQPQVDKDGKLLGAEALARWLSPTFGFVMPNDFIPVFEQNGLIYRLDEYIWDKSCQILKSWELMGQKDKYISINISYRDFYYMDVAQTLIELVEKYKVNVKNFRLEFTETVMVNDFNFCNEVISKLKDYGFIVEMDDFGSGYSSFSLVKDMSFVDVLKLDIGIVRECAQSERAGKITKSIIGLASEIGTSVVAEGVENKEQLDILDQFGCKVFQGFYFAKPMEASAFEEMYLSN